MNATLYASLVDCKTASQKPLIRFLGFAGMIRFGAEAEMFQQDHAIPERPRRLAPGSSGEKLKKFGSMENS